MNTLKYIANQCGLLTGSKSDLNINYTVDVWTKIILIYIKIPTLNNNENFECPISVHIKFNCLV